jgi:hypothetical protein
VGPNDDVTPLKGSEVVVPMIRLTTKDDGLPLDIYNPRENIRAVWEVEEAAPGAVGAFIPGQGHVKAEPEVVARVECSADGTAFRIRESAEDVRRMMYPEVTRPMKEEA